MKEFYYVHNRGKGNCTYRHSTKEEAIKEACRLGLETGKNFYVLKPVAHIVVNELDPNNVIIDGEFDKDDGMDNNNTTE